MNKGSVLVIEEVCPPELLAEVRAKFQNPIVVSSLAQARGRLEKSDFDLVLCGVHLPDGNWADVLSCLVHNGCEADFILCAERDDARLRSEVLGRGGSALVPAPYELPEVRRNQDLAPLWPRGCKAS
jgi:response regulator of citrate/malate metabolism